MSADSTFTTDHGGFKSRTRRRRPQALLLLAVLAGCGGGDKVTGPPPAAPATIRLESSAFTEGRTIPKRFSCDGRNVSPPLRWTRVPSEAKALAITVEDPDAPNGTYVHWVAIDLPPSTSSLGAGAKPPGTALENSNGDRSYTGPCPPKGDAPHHYIFSLYALKAPLRLDAGTALADARRKIGDQAVGVGRVTGLFGR